jgi:LuxR family maltose regulon positive regulatory protein
MAGHADPELVRQALARSDGWAVGLSMLLQAAQGAGDHAAALERSGSHALLFEYLAEEVLAELPEELREFLLCCSILDELNPRLCAAVSGRDDAGLLLRELNRRNLFVTPIDELVPVLRFHDLFREFLKAAARRRFSVEELDELHVRAAGAETVPARAVAHLIEARAWKEALARIGSIGEGLLAEGAISTVERWFEQIPESVRSQDAHVAYLNGTCGWLRWDWVRTKQHLPPAIIGLARPEDLPRRVRALFQLVDALNSAGELEAALQRLDEVSKLPLDDLGHAQLALQRAWCLAPRAGTRRRWSPACRNSSTMPRAIRNASARPPPGSSTACWWATRAWPRPSSASWRWPSRCASQWRGPGTCRCMPWTAGRGCGVATAPAPRQPWRAPAPSTASSAASA